MLTPKRFCLLRVETVLQPGLRVRAADRRRCGTAAVRPVERGHQPRGASRPTFHAPRHRVLVAHGRPAARRLEPGRLPWRRGAAVFHLRKFGNCSPKIVVV